MTNSPSTGLASAVTNATFFKSSLPFSGSRFQTRQAAEPNGLTFDPCRTNQDCQSDRKCELISSPEECNNRESCRCSPVSPVACESTADCTQDGEVCALVIRNDKSSRGLCVSKYATDTYSNYVEKNTQPPSTSPLLSTPLPLPSPSQIPASEGLSGDICRINSHCVGNRQCKYYPFEGEDPTTEECNDALGEVCICLPPFPVSCTTTTDCPDEGEVCSKRKEENEDRNRFCISKNALERNPGSIESKPSPSAATLPSLTYSLPPRAPSSCVEIQALSHLKAADLVYRRPRMTHVLCDSNGSCATAAHLVTYDGQPMMMRTYCEIAGCKREAMLVNSPKYQRGLVVKSKTSGLHFTALAAKYETRVEEVILSVAVHFGL